MAIVQCENKHYYDNSKYSECPHCQKARDRGEDPSRFSENKTIAKFSHKRDTDDNVMTQSLRNAVGGANDSQKTVALYFKDKNMNPIAGWLVCTDGENKGRSFEIHIGKNFVGRSMKMDIHTNDEKISRENHFSIIYEPNSVRFYVLQGKGITYYNGKILSDAEELSEGDEIEAGSSKYTFVPFCKEGRDWND